MTFPRRSYGKVGSSLPWGPSSFKAALVPTVVPSWNALFPSFPVKVLSHVFQEPFLIIPAKTEFPPALNGIWPCSDVSRKQVIAPLKIEAGDPVQLLSPPCLRNHSAVRSLVSSGGSQVGERTCTSFCFPVIIAKPKLLSTLDTSFCPITCDHTRELNSRL